MEYLLKNKQYILGLLFSLAVIGYVLAKLDWSEVLYTLSHLNGYWLIAAFGVYLINYLLRTLRFKILLNLEKKSFTHLFGITALYGMYLYLMPAKSGELSYPVLIKNKLAVPFTRSTATLITARVFDFITIALFLPLVLATFWNRFPNWLRYNAIVFFVLVLFLTLGFLWLLKRPGKKRIFANKHTWIEKIGQFLQNLIENIRAIDQQGGYWHVLLLTIGIWLCIYTTFYLIVLSSGFSPNYFHMVVVSIIMIPMTLLPLQGFANLGTHEIGWAAAFRLFGYSANASLNIAISSHIIMLLFVLTLGLLGYLATTNKVICWTANKHSQREK